MATQLFVNGKVFTGLAEDSFATAFRVSDGVFTWVGDEPSAEAGPVTDLGGKTVLPGFLDVHTHPAFLSSLADAVACLPPEVGSLSDLLTKLRTHPHLGRGDDLWIEGYGFDESKYPERRKPTAKDLDEVSPTQPIFLRRCDGHTAVCNTRALQLAGISRETPDPEGAAFERDADGQPNGILTEVAATEAVLAAKPALGYDEQVRRLTGLNEHFLERGIVAVADLLATFVPTPLQLFRDAERAGLLPQCALYYGWTELAGNPIPDLTDDDRTGRMKLAGIKLFMDGAYSNRTAWTNDPYPNSTDHGMRTLSDESMREAVAWARRNRVQVAFHAMGDRALNHVIDMFADQEPWMGDLPSIRLDHATLFPPEMIDRINAATMSFAVVSHTIFFFAEYDAYRDNLSASQLQIAYPIKSFYERVPYAALSSDHPATAWADADNVFVSIKAAVLRKAYNGADFNPREAITVPQALLLYTGRARGICALDQVGLIKEGCEASFMVLDRDIFSIPAAEIDQVQIAQTWLRGEKAWQR
jgi:predicted amidohydrolase YtcJ